MTEIATHQTLQSFNPATGDLVGSVPITPVDQIPNLIQRSRKAQREWRQLSFEARAAALSEGGRVLVDRRDRGCAATRRARG